MSVDSLGMYNLYNNPYFLQALNTPNINAQAVQQNLNQNQTNTAQTVTEDDLSTGNSPSFNGASEAIAENTKKSNTAANLILWGATLAATIWGGYKCHRKGVGENMFAKILDGAKQYWNKGIDAISKWKFNQKVASSQQSSLNTKPVGNGVVGVPKAVTEVINSAPPTNTTAGTRTAIRELITSQEDLIKYDYFGIIPKYLL